MPAVTRKKRANPSEEEGASTSGSIAAAPKPAKAPKKTKIAVVAKEEESKSGAAGMTVQIEHCKSWGTYKKKANEVVGFLQAEFPEVQVELNPEKPRSKSFNITVKVGHLCYLSCPVSGG